MHYRKYLLLASFLLVVFLGACASTKFSAAWRDETYQGRPEKVLVINAFPSPAARRIFEDVLVRELKDRSVAAVVSYNAMPEPIVSDKDAIAAQARAVGADTVLIIKPLGTTPVETSGEGGVVFMDAYISTQTDVYDMMSNRLVFSASAETWILQGKPYPDQIRPYVKDLVNKLSSMGLF